MIVKSILLTIVILASLAIGIPAAATDISQGVPGLKWGDPISNAKGYNLQHCGEPEEKGEPSFYTIISPEYFQLIGISAKKHNAWVQPIFWTHKNRLMGVQFDLTSKDNAVSTLLDNLGPPSRKISTNTRYGIYEWNIKGAVLVKGIDVGNGYMVQIYHIPSLKALNGIRKGLGKSAWE